MMFISKHERTLFSFGLMKSWPDLDKYWGIFSPTLNYLPSKTAATLNVSRYGKIHCQEWLKITYFPSSQKAAALPEVSGLWVFYLCQHMLQPLSLLFLNYCSFLQSRPPAAWRPVLHLYTLRVGTVCFSGCSPCGNPSTKLASGQPGFSRYINNTALESSHVTLYFKIHTFYI